MAYIGKSPSGTGVRSRFYFTQSSGGGTSISGTDDNSKTLTFTDGEYIDVYLNGVLLVAGTDYNTTSANTVAGLAALASGDVVEVVVYDIFTVADTVSASQGGTFNAAITANQVNADNIRIDGNTISSTDTNGDITLDPDGTGDTIIASGNVGIGETAPVTPLTIATTNKLGSTFTGTTNGEGLTVTQTNYTAGNYVSLVEAAYDDSNDANPNVRIGAMFDGGGSHLAFGTTTNYASGINNTAMFINSEGNVGIGTTSPGNKLNVHGAAEFNSYDNTSGGGGYNASGLLIGNAYDAGKGSSVTDDRNAIIWNERGLDIDFGTSNTQRMKLDYNGNLGVGVTSMVGSGRIYSSGSYSATTGLGANMVIESNGLISRSTSSQRYKNTINDATHGLTELMTLRPVTYKHNSNGDVIFGGLIAEEVHTAGLTEFVQYNDDNEPDALAYGNMVSLCIKAIQELKTELDAEKVKTATLETQRADLEARLTALENA